MGVNDDARKIELYMYTVNSEDLNTYIFPEDIDSSVSYRLNLESLAFV